MKRYFKRFFKKLSQMNYILSRELKTSKTSTYFVCFSFIFLFILDLVLFNIFLENMTALKYFCLYVITLILCYIVYTFKSTLKDSTCRHCKFGYLVLIPHKFRREKLEKNGDFSMFICENCGKIQ